MQEERKTLFRHSQLSINLVACDSVGAMSFLSACNSCIKCKSWLISNCSRHLWMFREWRLRGRPPGCCPILNSLSHCYLKGYDHWCHDCFSLSHLGLWFAPVDPCVECFNDCISITNLQRIITVIVIIIIVFLLSLRALWCSQMNFLMKWWLFVIGFGF